MKSANLHKNFINKNMKRQFVPRPSLPYFKFCNLDTVKDLGKSPEVTDGLS